LHKYGRPTDLKSALREGAKGAVSGKAAAVDMAAFAKSWRRDRGDAEDLAVQVTEGDGYCLGRVLISVQIAAPPT
jgi:hypothetical protein